MYRKIVLNFKKMAMLVCRRAVEVFAQARVADRHWVSGLAHFK